MKRRAFAVALLFLAVPASIFAQASDESRAEILRKLIAEESSARVDMPFGGEGVQLTEQGNINDQKLQKEIQKNGTSVPAGRIVKVTAIEFNSKSIDIELDGGGKAKKGLGGGHIQLSAGGGGNTQVQTPAPSTAKPKGSKISLMFEKKVPKDLTSNELKEFLAPVLDFSKRTITASNIESLPPEFQEAVLAKQAAIGMEEDVVLLAMGRPDRKTWDKVDGVEQETWIFNGRGVKKTFVTFEKSIVVKIIEEPGG
jgi:hypothetical protein